MNNKFIVDKLREIEDGVNSLVITPNDVNVYVVTKDGKLSGYWVRSYAFCMGDGHSEEMLSITSSPDSNLLATGAKDGNLIIWKPSVVGHRRYLMGHTGPVNSAVFTPDGKYVLSGGNDGLIKKWDVEALDLVFTFPKLSNSIKAIAISPNGGAIFAANGKYITIFDCSTGNILREIDAHNDMINDIAISPDVTYFVSASDDGTFKVWSSVTLDESMSFEEHDNAVKSVAISLDSRYIVSATGSLGNNKDRIYIWELGTGDLIQKLEGHQGSINCLAFSRNGEHLLSGSSDKSIIVWDFKKILEEKEIKEKEKAEQEKLEQERLEKERLEKERLEHERFEKERLEREKLEKERLEKERLEGERELEQERNEKMVKIAQKFASIGPLIQSGDFSEALKKTDKLLKKSKKYNFEPLIEAADNLLKSINTLIEYNEKSKIKGIKMAVSEIRLDTDIIKYDRKENRISVEILDYTFIGHYQKSEKISDFLNDVHASLADQQIDRNKIYVFDVQLQSILPEDTKIKKLIIVDKEELEKKEKEEEARRKTEILERQEKKRETIEKERIRRDKREIKEEKKAFKDKKVSKTKLAPMKKGKMDTDLGIALRDEMISDDSAKFAKQDILRSIQKAPKMKKKAMATRGAPTLPKPTILPPTSAEPPPPQVSAPMAPVKAPSMMSRKEALPPPPGSAPMAPVKEPSMMRLKEALPKTGEAAGPPPSPAGPPSTLAVPPPELFEKEAEEISEEDYEDVKKFEEIEAIEDISAMEGEKITDTRKKKILNMGMQYYSVVMEQNTYLFYVYISEKELIITDEVGKTVYKTTFEIEITKPEPPRLHIKMEGEGFEIHPIESIIEIKDDLKSQPTLVFSITALKSGEEKSKKEIKRGEKRFLHIIIEFEEKVVSHSVLAIKVQTKHFALDLGPIHLNMSKNQALMVSFLSILVSVISVVYTLLSMDLSGGGYSEGGLSGMVPGAGSLVFLLTFMFTLLKKGVFPMKHKISGLMGMDKPAMMK